MHVPPVTKVLQITLYTGKSMDIHLSPLGFLVGVYHHFKSKIEIEIEIDNHVEICWQDSRGWCITQALSQGSCGANTLRPDPGCM